jgi:hypothetical protein
MTASSELQRFVAEHASAEAQARLISAIGETPDAKTLATTARDQGYDVTDAEVATAMQVTAPVTGELRDDELDSVAAGSVDWNIRTFIGDLRQAARDGVSAETVVKRWI